MTDTIPPDCLTTAELIGRIDAAYRETHPPAERSAPAASRPRRTRSRYNHALYQPEEEQNV